MTIPPIHAVASIPSLDAGLAGGPTGATRAASAPESFAQLLLGGVNNVNQKISDAEKAATAFALDDSAVPLHQVMFALDEAKSSIEFMMQVRSRLIEAYQQFAGMQL